MFFLSLQLEISAVNGNKPFFKVLFCVWENKLSLVRIIQDHDFDLHLKQLLFQASLDWSRILYVSQHKYLDIAFWP